MRVASVVILICLTAFTWGCGGSGGYKDREGKTTPNPQGELEPIPGAAAPNASKHK